MALPRPASTSSSTQTPRTFFTLGWPETCRNALRNAMHSLRWLPRVAKRVQITDWFRRNESLGYAAIVQAVQEQVPVSRQKGTPSASYYDEESTAFYTYSMTGLTDIQTVEGVLIASHKETKGALPPWNKIQGAKRARQPVEGFIRSAWARQPVADPLIPRADDHRRTAGRRVAK